MPATRNIPIRRSRRLSQQEPTRYNEDVWETFPVDSSEDGSCSPAPSLPPLVYPSMSPVSPLVSEADSSDVVTPVDTQPPRPSHSKRRGSDHIPRPPNAFMMYRSWFCLQIKNGPNAEKNHAVISCSAAQRWRSLPDHERRYFQDLADIKKQEHRLRYPDYKYAPNFSQKASVTKKKASSGDDEDHQEDTRPATTRTGRATGRKPYSRQPRRARVPSPSPHIKSESPFISPALFLPSPHEDEFNPLESISPLDINTEVQPEPVFVQDTPVLNPGIIEAGFKSFLHPSVSAICLADSPKSTLGQVETAFNYTAEKPGESGCTSVDGAFNGLTFPRSFGVPQPEPSQPMEHSDIFDWVRFFNEYSTPTEDFRPQPEPWGSGVYGNGLAQLFPSYPC